MSNSDPPNKPGENPVLAKIVWLLAALSPAAMILFATSASGNSGSKQYLVAIVALGINPVLSMFGCYRLRARSDQSKNTQIAEAFFLGLLVAGLNICIGFFMGCVCNGRGFV